MIEDSEYKITNGIDIVYISRFENKMKNQTLLRKIFHPTELKNQDPSHLAGIFAAKEAIMKALALPLGSWLNIEIKYESSGKPFVELSENLKKKIKDISIGISHDKDYAIACCVASIIEEDKK